MTSGGWKWCLEAGIAFSRNLGSLTLIEKNLQNEKSRFFFLQQRKFVSCCLFGFQAFGFCGVKIFVSRIEGSVGRKLICNLIRNLAMVGAFRLFLQFRPLILHKLLSRLRGYYKFPLIMARSVEQYGSVALGSIPTTLCPRGRKNNVGIEPCSLANHASTHYSITTRASNFPTPSGHIR